MHWETHISWLGLKPYLNVPLQLCYMIREAWKDCPELTDELHTFSTPIRADRAAVLLRQTLLTQSKEPSMPEHTKEPAKLYTMGLCEVLDDAMELWVKVISLSLVEYWEVVGVKHVGDVTIKLSPGRSAIYILQKFCRV